MTTSGSALDLRRRLFARESSLLHAVEECMLSNECRRRGSEKGLPRKCFCLLVVVELVFESTDEALMLLGIKRPLISDVG